MTHPCITYPSSRKSKFSSELAAGVETGLPLLPLVLEVSSTWKSSDMGVFVAFTIWLYWSSV